MAGLRLTVVVAGLVLAGLEGLASRVHGANQDADTSPPSIRAPNVFVFPKQVDTQPSQIPAAARASVWVVGNSHTYALPSLSKGGDLRPDPGSTLVDEVARAVQSATNTKDLAFYRLSYPNFVAVEMLTRISQLLDAGHRPRLVILGIAWSNLARGSSVRASIRKLYQDQAFTDRRLQELTQLGVDARVLDAIRAHRRREEREEQEQRMLSAADRVDEVLNRHAGDYVALLGQSSAIRARLYRDFAYFIDSLIHSSGAGESNDIVTEDLALNLQAIDAIAAILTAHGARLAVYQNPERADLPPLVDVTERDGSMRWLRTKLESRGALLLDASRVVPDEMFGWEHDTPDRSHFTEPGHRLLADFLVAQLEAHAEIFGAVRAEHPAKETAQ